jgi:hypothetical protein
LIAAGWLFCYGNAAKIRKEIHCAAICFIKSFTNDDFLTFADTQLEW